MFIPYLFELVCYRCTHATYVAMCFLGTDGYKKLWSRREKGKIFTLDNYSVRNSYIFYGVTFVTLIFQQRRGYSVGFNLYGKCFKQDHGERCNGFFPFLMVTY